MHRPMRPSMAPMSRLHRGGASQPEPARMVRTQIITARAHSPELIRSASVARNGIVSEQSICCMAASLSDRERSLRATTVTIGREPSAKRWLAKREAPKAAGVYGEPFSGRLFRHLEAKAERKISRGLRRQPPHPSSCHRPHPVSRGCLDPSDRRCRRVLRCRHRVRLRIPGPSGSTARYCTGGRDTARDCPLSFPLLRGQAEARSLDRRGTRERSPN
jgi:hypothetical protein